VLGRGWPSREHGLAPRARLLVGRRAAAEPGSQAAMVLVHTLPLIPQGVWEIPQHPAQRSRLRSYTAASSWQQRPWFAITGLHCAGAGYFR
jgi:hypothetical protein